jgi:hypothetical protein
LFRGRGCTYTYVHHKFLLLLRGKGCTFIFSSNFFLLLRRRGVEVNVFFLFDLTYGKGEKGRWGV